MRGQRGAVVIAIARTAFPDSVTQASTSDIPLLRQYGDILGQETFAEGVNVFLGPGIDILRDPLNGRGWEYYGEDPYLTGRGAIALAERQELVCRLSRPEASRP